MHTRLVIVAALSLSFSARADYTFTRIVDTSQFTALHSGSQSINDSGDVAFTGISGGLGWVYVSTDGVLAPIANQMQFGGFSATTKINSLGDVVFVAMPSINPTTHAIVRGDASGFDVLLETATSEFDFFGQPDINDSGALGFMAYLDDDTQGMWRWNGAVGPLVQPSPTLVIFGRAALNEYGAVAFRARINGQESIALVEKNQPYQVIASTGFLSFRDPAINDAGVVAFVGQGLNGVWKLYTYEDGEIHPEYHNSSLVISGAVDINNSRQLVFPASLNGVSGLYYHGPDMAERIIQTGDELDGSTVTSTSFGFSRGCFNNEGQVAFVVTLADGRQGIYRANREPHGCYGDTNLSGTVNVSDLLNVINYWGQTPPTLPGADVNGDGTVNVDDLLGVVTAWGACPPDG